MSRQTGTSITSSTAHKKSSSLQRRVVSIAMSFAISIVVFILLRVLAVAQFIDLITDIIDFSVTSAINFMVWIGVVVMYVVSYIVILATVRMDEFKLNFNVLFSAILSIGIMFLCSYNYVGYTYPNLFAGLDMFQRIVVSAPYWVGIFAVYGLPDIFFFWLITSIIFYVLVTVFMSVDVKIDIFKKTREKSTVHVAITPSVCALPAVVSIAFYIVFFSLFLVADRDVIVFGTFTMSGMLVVLLLALINMVVFVASLKVTRSNDLAFASYFILSTFLTSIVFVFVTNLDALTATIMLLFANVVIYVISKNMVHRV